MSKMVYKVFNSSVLYNMFKRRLLCLAATCFVLFLSQTAWSQCSTTPVTESVRNGNFEAGYLTGNGSGGHNFAANGPFDFQSDLTYAGNFVAPSTCLSGIPNRYAVGRAEPGMPCTASARQAYAGTDYINNAGGFTDHTPGQSGNGFALIADFEAFGGTTFDQGAGALPAAWRQVVTIYPNQQYYFSAWFANYNRDAAIAGYNNPDLNFVVVPISAGVPQWASRQSLGTATPSGQMNWQQFYGTWSSPVGITSALLLIEVQQATSSNINDILIDDISFINGCSNLNSLPAAFVPQLQPDFSLCTTNGVATLTSGVATGGSTQFWWYSGTSTPQTNLVNASSSANTYNISAPGTYRVCVQNASFPGSCSASSTVVVTTVMPPVSLANQSICTATSATLTAQFASGATYSGTGLSYAWTVPSGAPASVNSATYSTSVTGTYSVQVSPGAGAAAAGCLPVTSNNATVTSNLVTPSYVTSDCSLNPRSFTFTSTVGSGNTYGWYDAATGGNLKGTGRPVTVTYTPAQLPATIYVENYNTQVIGPLRSAANSNDASDVSRGQTVFSAQQNFTLQSVWIRSDFGTGNITFGLVKDGVGGAGTASFNIAATGTWYQVPLNWPIVAGSNYIINYVPTGTIWMSTINGFSTTAYSGYATITPNTFGHPGDGFEWVIKTGATCLRSPFTVDCALPVEFLSFDAIRSGPIVNLDWVTASEVDAKLFIVERSLDGTHYTAIGEVKAKNSPSGAVYEFTDANAPNANTYYRLRQVDFNSDYKYSVIRYVTFASISELTLVPNPAQDVLKIILSSGTSDVTNASVQLFNTLGQELYAQAVSTNQLSQGWNIDLTGFAKGAYVVKVITTEGEWIEQLIKE